MKPKAHGALLLLCCATLFGQSSNPASVHQIVPGWVRTGHDPNGIYKINADTANVHGGKSSLSMRCETCSTAKSPKDATEWDVAFAAVGQWIKADAYRNKRIRFSAYMKTKDVSGDGATLWMRVDGNDGMPVAFDNMSEPDRSVHGTNDWKKYELVLDVPANASEIVLGALLSGRGQIWLDDASFDVVGKDTPATGDAAKYKQQQDAEAAKLTPAELADYRRATQQELKELKSLPEHPQNLGFEQ